MDTAILVLVVYLIVSSLFAPLTMVWALNVGLVKDPTTSILRLLTVSIIWSFLWWAIVSAHWLLHPKSK